MTAQLRLPLQISESQWDTLAEAILTGADHPLDAEVEGRDVIVAPDRCPGCGWLRMDCNCVRRAALLEKVAAIKAREAAS